MHLGSCSGPRASPRYRSTWCPSLCSACSSLRVSFANGFSSTPLPVILQVATARPATRAKGRNSPLTVIRRCLSASSSVSHEREPSSTGSKAPKQALAGARAPDPPCGLQPARSPRAAACGPMDPPVRACARLHPPHAQRRRASHPPGPDAWRWRARPLARAARPASCGLRGLDSAAATGCAMDASTACSESEREVRQPATRPRTSYTPLAGARFAFRKEACRQRVRTHSRATSNH